MKENDKWFEEKIDKLMEQNNLPDHNNKVIQDWNEFRKGALMGYKAGYLRKEYGDKYWEEYFECHSRNGKFTETFEKGYNWGHKHGIKMQK